jgi:hypothetical protein
MAVGSMSEPRDGRKGYQRYEDTKVGEEKVQRC